MIRKCHKHILQTSNWHREEESKNGKSDMTFKTLQSKATISLFLSNMIAKLERTQSTAKQNKGIRLNPHKQWEQQQTMNIQQQNRHLRTDGS